MKIKLDIVNKITPLAKAGFQRQDIIFRLQLAMHFRYHSSMFAFHRLTAVDGHPEYNLTHTMISPGL